MRNHLNRLPCDCRFGDVPPAEYEARYDDQAAVA